MDEFIRANRLANRYFVKVRAINDGYDIIALTRVVPRSFRPFFGREGLFLFVMERKHKGGHET